MRRALARQLALGGTLVLVALQWGCAGHRAQPPPSPGSPTVIQAPRSDRGNPPFYDVLGKRYYVLESADGYVAEGIASWYGPGFHGLSTSSGERYDMHAMTAAHTTLPIPTWVEVTNLENGRKVVVKVNDRGPFVRNRLIDLSYAAALELDMIKKGTARVRVRALGTPPPAEPLQARDTLPRFEVISSATADTVRPDDRPLRQMFVQVGAFADRTNAERLAAELEARGFRSFVLSQPDGRRTLHRVRLGPVADDAEFDRVRGRLRALGYEEAHLVVD
ncbi:MAG TPA: septal ring lytic transglycosylase RlpA family protein [Gammaproteobacteria bacterium]